MRHQGWGRGRARAWEVGMQHAAAGFRTWVVGGRVSGRSSLPSPALMLDRPRGEGRGSSTLGSDGRRSRRRYPIGLWVALRLYPSRSGISEGIDGRR